MPAFDFVLADRYRLLGPLGEGGMAAVYRARDLRLNREVAVKILREDLTRDPEFSRRFEREAQFVASLSHPHIVPVHDVGEENGTRYIVMEYVRGRTLADCIERESHLSPDRARSIILPVLDALQYAHERGIIHRDVKPQNILLSPDGQPRLADFGIAHLAGSSATHTAAILGSAHYLSPEQSRGEEATPQSDIYACGIVLWEMLAGVPPFDGPNALAIANQHLQAPVPSLCALAPDVSEELEEAVRTALAKEPEERFADADAFADALRTERSPVMTAVQPLIRATSTLDHTESQTTLQVARIAPNPLASLQVRRSARKTYLLGCALSTVLLCAGYVATLQQVQGQLPHYPSAGYWLVPAALALIFLTSFFNTRSWIYSLDSTAAIARWGLLTHHRFAVPLHQVASVRLKQSPLDRIIGVGTVELAARDADGLEERLIMQDIPDPRGTYDRLLHLLAQSRAGSPGD